MKKISSLLSNPYHDKVEKRIKMIDSSYENESLKAGYMVFLEERLNSDFPYFDEEFSKIGRRILRRYNYLMEHFQTPDGAAYKEMFLYDVINFYWFEDFALVIHRERVPVWKDGFPGPTGYKDGGINRVRIFTGEKLDIQFDLLYLN